MTVPLREKRAIAREEPGIEVHGDRGRIERLIGHPVAIAAGIGRRKEDEEDAGGGKPRPADHMLSSAVWP